VHYSYKLCFCLQVLLYQRRRNTNKLLAVVGALCGVGAPLCPPCPFTSSSFPPFYFSLSFIGFTFFLLLSIPSLSTRIVPINLAGVGRCVSSFWTSRVGQLSAMWKVLSAKVIFWRCLSLNVRHGGWGRWWLCQHPAVSQVCFVILYFNLE